MLRRVSRDNPGDWMTRVAEGARSDDERLGLVFSHPVWVVRAFRRALAAEGRADELEALLTADNAAPRVTMAALPELAEIPEDARRTPYSPLGFRLGGRRSRCHDPRVGRPPARAGRRLAARGARAHAAPRRSRRGSGGSTCAPGPGGKTAVLAAEALRHGSAPRGERDLAGARRTRAAGARGSAARRAGVGAGRARQRRRSHPSTYDRILVDAPCTGLGALRRRPEARWRKSPADVAQLTQLQRELLDGAIGALKPGGIVAYITCSPHLGETAAVVADVRREWGGALTELDARAVVTAISMADPGLPPQADGTGRAQLWPHRHNTDAMSISLLRRV